jgi:hypothetical protein
MPTHPNIRFAYLYRDASNYKQHSEVIFSNEKQLSMNEIEKQIRSFLNDSEFFIARQIHLEERFFDVLYDDDHPWHEFVRVEATNDPIFDPDHEHTRDIAEFLVELENACGAGWDEMNVREDLARQFTQQKRALKQRLESGGEDVAVNPSCG